MQDPAGCSLSAKRKAYYRRAKARAELGYGIKVGDSMLVLKLFILFNCPHIDLVMVICFA